MPLNKLKVEDLNFALVNETWRTRVQALLRFAAERDLSVKFATSFGVEDQLLTHQLAESLQSTGAKLEIFTLDTGRLFPSTYQVWQETQERYNLRVTAFYPNPSSLEDFVNKVGINAFYKSIAARKDCCAIRKIEPLTRALADADIWITGVRRSQDPERAQFDCIETDARFKVVKVNPLLELELDEMWNFVKENQIPYNSLHDQGFPSIGCAPCTRAVQPGEPIRAGRWWWESDLPKECGLHSHKISAA